MVARLHQISVSDGGVPKLPIETATIDAGGVVGDRQEDLVHHGSPEQALCLYSLEVIERLRNEGHPIGPGSAGENLTISGLDWEEVTPGKLMKVGAVELEITYYTSPCSKNAQWFKAGRFDRMSQDKHPGDARVYAKVLVGGDVSVGDPVSLGA